MLAILRTVWLTCIQMANGLVSGTAAAFLLVLFYPAPETLLPLAFPGFLLFALVALVVAVVGARMASDLPAQSRQSS